MTSRYKNYVSKIQPLAWASKVFLIICSIILAESKDGATEHRNCQDDVQAVAALDWDHNAISADRCPLTKKLVTWIRYRQAGDKEDIAQVMAFIDQNPNWPGLDTIQTKLESGLPVDIAELDDAKALYKWFNKHKPVSVFGAYIYAKLMLEYGNKTAAVDYIRQTWRKREFYDKLFKRYLKEFGDYLTEVDHNHRANNMLWNRNMKAAKKVLPYVAPDYRKLCQARIALIKNSKDVVKKLNAVPSDWANHPGLLYDRIHRARKLHDNEFLWQLLQKSSTRVCQQNHPRKWWKERNILGRRLMEQKKFSQAYKVIKGHCQVDGISYSEAEFLAGWLALRFSKKPQQALQHFNKFRKNVSTPMSVARGEFWLGEAAQAMGKEGLAKQHWKKAAEHPGIYYGQIALSRLGQLHLIKSYFLTQPKTDTKAAQAFKSRELVKVYELLNLYELVDYAEIFVSPLAMVATDRTRQALLLDMSYHPYLQMLVTKKSSRHQLPRLPHAFPIIEEADDHRHEDIGSALAHAIMRQESRFKHDDVSSAGATGLMQLMPFTAKQMAKHLGIKLQSLSNKGHNIRLGTTYLRKMLDEFNGSVVLATAAYNAGPAPVYRWIEQYYGHPFNNPKYDIIDWVELIPYHETRNYVQRVLENYMVYRIRLGLPPKSMLDILTTKFK